MSSSNQSGSNHDTNSPAKRLARHLGSQLRRIRLAAGYSTQAALATRIGFGEDVIQKGETGYQPPSDTVFPVLIEACRMSIDGRRQVLSDDDIVALTELWEIVREGKRDSAVPDFARRWYDAERVAEFLRLWAIALVPGLLQAPPYARALFEALGLDEDGVQELLSVLAERQSILDGPDPVQVIAILHESVLHQLIGSPSIMASQLTHLLAISQRQNVTIQVVRGPGAYPGLTGPFQIASAQGEPDTVMMPAFEDQTTADPALTRKAAVLFEKIRRHALNVEDSRAVIREALHHWESQQ